MMQLAWVFIGMVLGAAVCLFVKAVIDLTHDRRVARRDWMDEPPPTVEPAKFRVRTATSDPYRHAHVRMARIIPRLYNRRD